MVPSVRIALALLFSVTCAQAELHFTFENQEYDLDGVKLRQLVFTDGAKHIAYTPPRGWQYFGQEDRLRLLPPSGKPGEGLIFRIPMPKPQPFDERTTKSLADEAIASVPNGAKRVSLVSQQKNAVVIEGKETYLVVINFELFGTPQARSIMFLNRDNDQVRFQFTCPLANFADLQKQFFSSQFSWQNL
jgi:hypothetical protein